MADQVDQKIFELYRILFPKENPFYLKFFDDFTDFRLQKFYIWVKKRLVQRGRICEMDLFMGVF